MRHSEYVYDLDETYRQPLRDRSTRRDASPRGIDEMSGVDVMMGDQRSGRRNFKTSL